MAIRTGGDQGGIFATINITPLTDIFLVLLIIFMVATAVTIESAAHVYLPTPQASSQKQQSKGVTVTYTSDHQIYVGQTQVSEQQLGPALHEELDKKPDKLVVFDGDPTVILGDMVRILDIAKNAGATQIALAVTKNPVANGGSQAPAEPEPITPGTGPAPETIAPSGGP